MVTNGCISVLILSVLPSEVADSAKNLQLHPNAAMKYLFHTETAAVFLDDALDKKRTE